MQRGRGTEEPPPPTPVLAGVFESIHLLIVVYSLFFFSPFFSSFRAHPLNLSYALLRKIQKRSLHIPKNLKALCINGDRDSSNQIEMFCKIGEQQGSTGVLSKNEAVCKSTPLTRRSYSCWKLQNSVKFLDPTERFYWATHQNQSLKRWKHARKSEDAWSRKVRSVRRK